jgi:hypothetical protein
MREPSQGWKIWPEPGDRDFHGTMNRSMTFEGRFALVTGASSDSGVATAKAFGEADAAVVLADINDAALDDRAAHQRRR